MDKTNDELEYENICNLEPGVDDFIKRRICHYSFSKLLYWLWVKSKENDYITMRDLTKYMKLTKTRCYNALDELCNVRILKKVYKGNEVEYWFIKEGDKIVIAKYVDACKKVLGII